ncbi:sugar efflux transporter for intercellular exchange domain-containing protein [Ditylenchus destructor]|nr:sugar efflux transporter for intercellular exchange domain-containing protein [Ditylenchus destructor]
MVVVNVVGVILMITYLIFYTCYTKSRKLILAQIFLDVLAVSIMLSLVHLFGQISREPLGFVSMSFNIINFGSPLAGLAVVFRTRNCETMPLPMCIGVLLVSSQWCLYGFIIHDKYLIVPNGAGVILALIQISLFLIFPRKTGNVAPLGYCCPIVRKLADSDPKHAINGALKGNSKGIWNVKNKVGDISPSNGSKPVAVSLENSGIGAVRITVDEA